MPKANKVTATNAGPVVDQVVTRADGRRDVVTEPVPVILNPVEVPSVASVEGRDEVAGRDENDGGRVDSYTPRPLTDDLYARGATSSDAQFTQGGEEEKVDFSQEKDSDDSDESKTDESGQEEKPAEKPAATPRTARAARQGR
jgi:hypothetical protein